MENEKALEVGMGAKSSCLHMQGVGLASSTIHYKVFQTVGLFTSFQFLHFDFVLISSVHPILFTFALHKRSHQSTIEAHPNSLMAHTTRSGRPFLPTLSKDDTFPSSIQMKLTSTGPI